MRKKKVQDESAGTSGRLGEFGSAISQISDEKGISKDKVIETIEMALAAAYKKDYGKRGQNIKAVFDEVTGTGKFLLLKEVVDETTREFVVETEVVAEPVKEGEAVEEKVTPAIEVERFPRFNPERDIILAEAKKVKKGAKLGDILEFELEPQKDYGRVAAQTAKQVIIQRIREAERDSMFMEYKEKEGEVINGIIQRVEGRNVFVDLGKSVGVLFPTEQIKSEQYRVGQRIKVYLFRVEADPKGPGITLSRTHPEMVRKLFELEVPEIFAGTVEIKSIAREAGFRTKIAVTSAEKGVDPIGSCVGQKGTRVQAVIDELGGEKIDIIEWNESAPKYISSALSPAKVLSCDINEEMKEANVIVPEEQLSLAIGRQGQNVRLAAKLTGWRINVAGGGKTEPVVAAAEETPEGEGVAEDKAEEVIVEDKGEIKSEE